MRRRPPTRCAAIALAGIASAGLAAMAAVAAAAPVAASPSDPDRAEAAAMAACIARHLPRGAQVFRDGVGDYEVVVRKSHSETARWIVAPAPGRAAVHRRGGLLPTERGLERGCG